jgi:hypothetical protein
MKNIHRSTNVPIQLSLCRKAAIATVVAAAFSLAGIAQAHHSYAMFDLSKTATLDGTVKEFQWTNPHAWIEVITLTADGPKQYSIEGNNLRVLGSAGWKFNTLKPGDKITVVINPLRDGAPGGSLVSATLEDGRTLNGH